MPQHVSFSYDDSPHLRPTVTIYENGTYKEHRPFQTARKATVNLYANPYGGPKKVQLDLAQKLAAAAVAMTPDCVIEFGPQTSPWTYEFFARAFGDEFVEGYAG